MVRIAARREYISEHDSVVGPGSPANRGDRKPLPRRRRPWLPRLAQPSGQRRRAPPASPRLAPATVVVHIYTGIGVTKETVKRVGRPPGPRMLCGWRCGAQLACSEMRKHFTACSRRPKRPMDETGSAGAAQPVTNRRWKPSAHCALDAGRAGADLRVASGRSERRSRRPSPRVRACRAAGVVGLNSRPLRCARTSPVSEAAQPISVRILLPFWGNRQPGRRSGLGHVEGGAIAQTAAATGGRGHGSRADPDLSAVDR